MVENQHRQITGYRDLTEAEIALMNDCKEAERQIATLLRRVVETAEPRSEPARQAAIARTEFEGAFMRIVRAVAKPMSPWAE